MLKPSILDVSLDYLNAASFVEGFGRVSRERIDIPSPFNRGRGESVRFMLRTADQRVVLEGEGVIERVGSVPSHASRPEGRYDLTIRITRLDARNEAMIERMLICQQSTGEVTGVRRDSVPVVVKPALVAAASAPPVRRWAPSVAAAPATPASQPLPRATPVDTPSGGVRDPSRAAAPVLVPVPRSPVPVRALSLPKPAAIDALDAAWLSEPEEVTAAPIPLVRMRVAKPRNKTLPGTGISLR